MRSSAIWTVVFGVVVFLTACIDGQNPSVSNRLSMRYSKQGMFFALEPASGLNASAWIAVDNLKTAKVALCKGKPEGCKVSLTEDIRFNLPPEGKKKDSYFFKSASKMPLAVGDYTILGFDNGNNLLDSQGIHISEDIGGSGLTNEQDIDLKQSDGGSVKLSRLFEGEYFIIDFSGASCSACVSLATSSNDDEDFKALFTGKKCSFAALISERDLKDWNDAIGGQNSFVGQRSYGLSMGHADAGKLFGIDVAAIPTVFMIDRNGKVVDSKEGELPDKASTLCGSSGSSTGLEDDSGSGDDISSGMNPVGELPGGDCGPSSGGG